MDIPEIFRTPVSLAVNQRYLLRIARGIESIPVFTPVTFIGFTTCPAVVVVQDARNSRFPCSRENLFSHNGKDSDDRESPAEG